jgi:hypothetical protein
MDETVTPNHFSVEDFEQFNDLTAAQEFDLVAPLLVYFRADMRKKAEARAALVKLRSLNHPMVDTGSVTERLMLEPVGLPERYNALMMKLVSEHRPEAEAYIDTYGAYGFKVPGDPTLLCGDASGFFAFYMDAKSVQERLEM